MEECIPLNSYMHRRTGNIITKKDKPTTNKKLFAMLVDEYIIIFLSLSNLVRTQRMKSQLTNLILTSVFLSASVLANVTQNTSTAESPNVKCH